MKPLRLTTAVRSDEHLPSYVCRMAALHEHSSSVDFASSIGLVYRHLFGGRHDDVARFAYMVGAETGRLEAVATSKPDRVTTLIKGHPFHRSSFDWNRVCPHCMVEDEDSGTGRRGARAYGRLHWLPTYAKTCGVHGCGLVELPRVGGKYFAEVTFRLGKVDGGLSALVSRTSNLKPSKLQLYCDNRLSGGETDGKWFDKLSIQAVAYAAYAVGADRLEHRLLERRSTTAILDAENAGFELLSDNENCLRDFIVDRLDRMRCEKPDRPLLNALGPFGYRLDDLASVAGFQELADHVHKAIQETRPVQTGQTLFGRRFVRKVHSIRSAAFEYGFPFSVLRAALTEAGHLPMESSRDDAAVAVFDVGLVAELVARLEMSHVVTSSDVVRFRNARAASITTVTDWTRGNFRNASTAAGKLTISFPIVRALMEDGHLRQFRFKDSHGIFVHWPEVEALSARLVSAKNMWRRLNTAKQTLESFVKRHGLGPVITADEVGQDFYDRAEFEAAF